MGNDMNIEEFSAELGKAPRRRLLEYRESFERYASQLDIRALATIAARPPPSPTRPCACRSGIPSRWT
jgi:hypothetical protein